MEKRDTLQESLGGASNEFPPFLVCAYTVIRISVSVAVKVWERGRENVAGASSSKMGKRKGDYAKRRRRRRQGRGLSRSRALQKMYYCVMHVPSLHPTSSHRSFPFPSSVEKNLFWNQSCVIGNPISSVPFPLRSTKAVGAATVRVAAAAAAEKKKRWEDRYHELRLLLFLRESISISKTSLLLFLHPPTRI